MNDRSELAALDAAIAAHPPVDLTTVSDSTFATMCELLVATAFSTGLDDHYFTTYLGSSQDRVGQVGAIWARRKTIALDALDAAWRVLVNAATVQPVRGWTSDCPPVTALEAAMEELEPISHRVVQRLAKGNT